MNYLFKITLFLLINGQSYGQQCKVPNGGAGTCIPIKRCTPILNYSKKPDKTRADVQFLQQTSCGHGSKPKVCCPHESDWDTYAPGSPVYIPVPVPTTPAKENKTTILINTLTIPVVDNPNPNDYRMYFAENNCPGSLKPPKYESDCCGVDASNSDKIYGGIDAAIDEYPWLALLVYGDQQIRCGGALVSSRYILTAAHCVGNTRFGPAVIVRLAEYNTTSYPTDYVESNGDGFDEVTVLEVTIERQIRHPQYSLTGGTTVHDIGLVKLTRNAPYSDFIRPICLPTYDATISPEEDFQLTAAGWGSNTVTFNTIKQKVKLPLFDTEQCKKTFKSAIKDQFCAGGVKGKDTCHGDSGGPIVYEDETKGKAIIVGVVSYGHKYCGTENYPGVYTNVYKYLDWIEKEIV